MQSGGQSGRCIILSSISDVEYEIDDDIGEASGKGTVTAVIPGSPDKWVIRSMFYVA